MLVGISIRNLVLIDRLDLQLSPGLTVLTGETGAGKSILLDALGLATGARADSGLIRKGSDQAAVSAEFLLPAAHPAMHLLSEQGIDVADGINLRRVINNDGRSRAFANDQAISIGLLRTVGDLLIEVHGQNDDRGLLNTSGHRALLDAFGDLAADLAACRQAHRELLRNQEALDQARAGLQKAQMEEDYLRHVLGELESLSPQPGEETELASARTLMMHSEKLADEINAALGELSAGSGGGAEGLLISALRRLERIADKAAGRLDATLAILSQACSDVIEANAQLETVAASMEFSPHALEAAEARLFALRAAARKHHVSIDALADLQTRIAGQLSLLDAGATQLAALEMQYAAAQTKYDEIAAQLSQARTECALRLDKAVKKELAPLKLDKAVFRTVVRRSDTERGAEGIDRVEFQVATNPGAHPGPLIKIASGGELSRFMLALRMVLAKSANARAMVFDEVDSAVGGAVADAIGDRLARLAAGGQVLVVTHSPQVAVRGQTHWRVQKRNPGKGGSTTTSVEVLDQTARREEVARMLAGAEVTDAARAAADSLMAAGARP